MKGGTEGGDTAMDRKNVGSVYLGLPRFTADCRGLPRSISSYLELVPKWEGALEGQGVCLGVLSRYIVTTIVNIGYF